MGDNVSVIEIDVRDEKFKAFYATFQKYEANLKQMPEEWRKAASSIILNSKEMEAFNKKTAAGADNMERMKIAATKTADAIKSIAGGLLKIGGIAVALSGIGAIFTGAGLRALSNSAIQNQNAGARLGLTNGQYLSWQTFMAPRFGESALSGISAAQAAGNKSGALGYLAGVSPSEAQTMNPAQLTKMIIANLARQYNSASPDKRNALFQNPMLKEAGLSIEDVRQFAANESILNKQFSKYENAANAWNLSERQTNAWAGVGQSINASGNDLMIFFQKQLAGNVGAIGDLIEGLEGSLKTLIKNVLTPENLKAIEQAMADFTQYLGSNDFKSDLETFAEILAKIVRGTEWVLGIDSKEDKQRRQDMLIKREVGALTNLPTGTTGYASALEALTQQGFNPRVLPASATVTPKSGEIVLRNESGAQILLQANGAGGLRIVQ